MPCCSEIDPLGLLVRSPCCVQHLSSFMCLTCLGFCILSRWPTVIPVAIFFSIESVDHCSFCFLSHVYVFTVLLVPFTSVGRVAAATIRLHNSALSPLVFVSSVKAASRDAVADAKFMKAYSISPCFTFFVLPYPAAPTVCLIFSLSRYASWECALSGTYAPSLSAILFHMQYACVYSCVASIFVITMSASCWY